MTDEEEEEVEEDEHIVEEDDRVFSPDGFGIVLKTRDRVALVDFTRPTTTSVEKYDFDELEVVSRDEWPIYEAGPMETPHR